MSISQEIQRIKTNIANVYTVAGNKGATLPEVQNSANLASTIEGIPSGGGTPISVKRKDVNFFDYDGTLLYSYTLDEINNLTELPPLPSHEGLICQGWNWNLADIKAEEKETDVGAMYITNDGKTRLYINIVAESRKEVSLCFQQSVENGVEVDWGDESIVETFSGSGSTNILPTHKYTNVGDYVITLNPIDECRLTLGSNNRSVVSTTSSLNYFTGRLNRAELGRNVAISGYAFYRCSSLKSITIPNDVIIPNYSYCFEFCYGLRCIIFPNVPNANIYCNTLFGDYCYISKPVLSKSIKSIRFKEDKNLQYVSIPNDNGVTSSMFMNCNLLKKITLPKNLTQIPEKVFYYCYNLTEVFVPKGVTSIGSDAFYYCNSMVFYDFSSHISIPGLANTNAFKNIPSFCKIIVPDSLYDNWISATNWATYASYIISKTDWEAMQNAS